MPYWKSKIRFDRERILWVGKTQYAVSAQNCCFIFLEMTQNNHFYKSCRQSNLIMARTQHFDIASASFFFLFLEFSTRFVFIFFFNRYAHKNILGLVRKNRVPTERSVLIPNYADYRQDVFKKIKPKMSVSPPQLVKT